jgi:hypothetical protein
VGTPRHCVSCSTFTAIDQHDDIEVWTALSSAKFGKRYKGAQENLSDDLIEQVTDLMLQSLEESLILPPKSLGRSVLESRLQLWGAGVPLNTWVPDMNKEDEEARGFLYDSQYNVGACGDWLLESSVAGAWESGRRLAEFIASDPESSVGLEGRFQASTAVDKVGIGSLS